MRALVRRSRLAIFWFEEVACSEHSTLVWGRKLSEINCQWRHYVTRQFYDNDEHLIADHFDYMGYLGWELVTVVAYPDKGYNAAYWKQSQVARDKLKTLGLPDYPGLGNW